jgi:hypothetical protein
MNLPDQPATFRPPNPTERPWWWRLEDGSEAGVAQVTLLEHDRVVYGPMSLHA